MAGDPDGFLQARPLQTIFAGMACSRSASEYSKKVHDCGVDADDV